jgi:HEAT repeat protein
MSMIAALLAAVLAQDDPLSLLGSEDPAERRRGQEALLARGADGVTAALRLLESSAPDPGPEVERWVGRLSSPRWKERDEAMRALARLGRPAKAALEAKARSADAEVAWRVRAALAELQEQAGKDEAREEFRNLSLCEVLGESGDRRAVAPVLRFLAPGGPDARPELRLKAAWAAARLRGRMEAREAEEASERILALLEKAQAPQSKSLLIRALGRLRAPQSLRPLAALLADRSERNVSVKTAALGALAESGDAAALKAVVDALLAEEAYVRQGAAAVLEGLSGGPLGFDALGTIETNRAAIEKARAWWSKKAGRDWED